MKKLILPAVLAAALFVRAEGDDEALERARARLATMTLEEKTLLTAGNGTMTLAAIPRAGITNEWTFSDNSSAVRRPIDRWTWDNAEGSETVYATALPTMSALAATWNPDLAFAHGAALGAEARGRGVDQILGPGVNIMRTPLCGRNWEYTGEDPCLAASLVAPLVRGIQSRDVAATVKHFCLNNQELNRNSVDTVCDERTLNEIYLPAFRAALVEAGGLAVMTAYNKVNGDWASENAYLQRGILRDRWRFPGMIVTDWGGAHSTVKGALAGGGDDSTGDGGAAAIIAGSVDAAFGKVQTAQGALYDADGKLAGAVTLKVGKKSKKGIVKISGSALLLNGKKAAAKAVQLTPGADGSGEVALVFKAPVGAMTLKLAADGTFTCDGSGYTMVKAEVGGSWTASGAKVYLDATSASLPSGTRDELLPTAANGGEPVVPKGGKWGFAKAAQVKWAKDRATGEFGLTVNTAGGKTNTSALKLTYAPKTGLFKGSFKVYAVVDNRLKKYTAKVTGLVVDGKGQGTATMIKPSAATWTVAVGEE